MKVLKKLKATKGDKHERKKEQKRIETKRQHLKVLIKYINKDYADVKNRSVDDPPLSPPGSQFLSEATRPSEHFPSR